MIFIKYLDIKDEITIDVRTKSEFKNMNLFQYNLPVISEEEHKKIKNFYPSAIFIIVKSIFLKRSHFKNELVRISNNGTIPIVIGCSRGRLRSPLMYLFCKYIGIKNSKILWAGIKPLFKNNLYIQNKKIYRKKDSHN